MPARIIRGVARSPRDWKRAGPLLGYVGAMLFAFVLCVVYVRTERTVHFWDFAGYHNLVWRTASAFRESVAAGIVFVHDSLGQSYNALFALPLAPLQALFGSSRLTYVLSVALVYHVPYAVVLGLIAARHDCASSGSATKETSIPSFGRV